MEPDQAVLAFGVVGKDLSYSTAVGRLNDRVEALRADLELADIERTRLKTTDFDVRAEHDYVEDKRVFRGYVASHRLRLELPLEKELLNHAFERAALSTSEATIHISFEVRDGATLRRRTLGAAVEDARENAMVLASAAGVTLGEIQRIDYGSVEVRVRYASLREPSAPTEFSMPDFEPEDVESTENVTMVWRIR